MGSNMAPLMVSGGGPLRPPPMGATESDRSWEIGLRLKFEIQKIEKFLFLPQLQHKLL